MFKLTILLLAALPAHGAEPLALALRESYQTMRLYLIAASEMMSEENYSFKLTPVSRTFGDWMKHTAEMNYGSCTKLHGGNPPDPKILESAKTKEALVRELKASFTFCDTAFRGISDRQLLAEKETPERRFYPVTEMVGLTNSLHEHYGNLIGYLRSKGVTPPSTLRTQRVLQ